MESGRHRRSRDYKEREGEIGGNMDISEQYIQMCEKAKEIQDYVRSHEYEHFPWKEPDNIFAVKGTLRKCSKCGVMYQNDDYSSYKYCSDCGGEIIDSNEKTFEFRGEPDFNEKHFIWIPRQDQLQKMVKTEIWFENLYRFYDWINKDKFSKDALGMCNKFDSLEQLWLTFVMHEKYGKIWDGENWINKTVQEEKEKVK